MLAHAGHRFVVAFELVDQATFRLESAGAVQLPNVDVTLRRGGQKVTIVWEYQNIEDFDVLIGKILVLGYKLTT